MKENETVTTILLVFVGITAAVFAILGIKSFTNNDRQKLEDYRQRLDVCFDYSPRHGDYVWRHDYCRDADKEYLEVFNEIYGNAGKLEVK